MKETKQVLWSGGLDSTYMIYKLLQEKYKVEAHYAQLDNNPAKTKRELLAIQKISKLFSAYDFEYKGILGTFDIHKNGIYGYVQSPIWMLAAYYLPGPVNIGFVKNDDAISYLDDFMKIADALSVLRDTQLKLEFPLSKISKLDILTMLPNAYVKLVTCCEGSGKTPCGKCCPCLRHKTALADYKLLMKKAK